MLWGQGQLRGLCRQVTVKSAASWGRLVVTGLLRKGSWAHHFPLCFLTVLVLMAAAVYFVHSLHTPSGCENPFKGSVLRCTMRILGKPMDSVNMGIDTYKV